MKYKTLIVYFSHQISDGSRIVSDMRMLVKDDWKSTDSNIKGLIERIKSHSYREMIIEKIFDIDTNQEYDI